MNFHKWDRALTQKEVSDLYLGIKECDCNICKKENK